MTELCTFCIFDVKSPVLVLFCKNYFEKCGKSVYSRWGLERVGRITVNTLIFLFIYFILFFFYLFIYLFFFSPYTFNQ